MPLEKLVTYMPALWSTKKFCVRFMIPYLQEYLENFIDMIQNYLFSYEIRHTYLLVNDIDM